MSEHISVLLKEAVKGLAINPEGVYIDCTFGRGGHSQAILEQLAPAGRLIGIDQDTAAIAHGQQRFAAESRLQLEHASFAQLQALAAANEVCGTVDGILLDLGVSSPQIDEAERGFSFMQDGPLDMRMNPTQTLTAASWINQVAETEMADVMYQYGEERYSRRIAKAIVKARLETEITRTLQLAEIIKEAHPKWEQHKHPATRVFQAIRIFINDEFGALKRVLTDSLDVLKPGGRLVVVSFHSLEDRIVKQFMRLHAKGPTMPRHLPLPSGQEQVLRLKLMGKAIKPSADEIKDNIRSRSAVLRIAEKI
jgi:16S rRNA (cytosine1402-N4)-methyltransferase